MTDSPKCANCFEEIAWTPVLVDGEVYCCDGCVIGGPCVCTYDGPPRKLDTKDILEAAGYDLEALAAELSVCANCFDEFTREPVMSSGTAYCCQGCVRGGPCTCTYGDTEMSNAPDLPKLIYEESSLADFDLEADLQPKSSGEAPGYLKTNSFWQQLSDWDDSPPHDETRDEDQRVNDFWLLRPDITGVVVPEGDEVEAMAQILPESQEYEFDSELDLESSSNSVAQRKTFKVVASPLEEVADVRSFTAALDATPSVESVILTHYSGDSATFEIDARDLDTVLRELLEADLYPVRSFSMTPEGLELTLRSSSGDLLATATRSENAGADFVRDPSLREGQDLTSDGFEGGSFKFEMGVDVFFNGRHHVEVSGIEGPVHMHSWRIQATLAGQSVDEAGSLVGTQLVKDIMTAYVGRFNEKLLNKISPFDETMPSSNNIARVIYDHVSYEMEGKAPAGSAPVLKSIRLWESPTSYVEYSGDARAA